MATSERPVADVEVNGEVVSLPVVPVVRSEAAAAPAASNDGSQKQPSPGKVACPQNVMDAIYGKKTSADKKKAYEASLQRWWEEYSDRKNDEEDEHVSDSLLYDRSHLPRSIPAPDCVILRQPSRPGGASQVVAAGVTVTSS